MSDSIFMCHIIYGWVDEGWKMWDEMTVPIIVRTWTEKAIETDALDEFKNIMNVKHGRQPRFAFVEYYMPKEQWTEERKDQE